MAEELHFTGIEVWRAEFAFRFAFSHNLATRDRAETILVALRRSDGTTGYGQALPRSYLTGETVASAATDIVERWWPALGKIPFPKQGGLAAVLGALRPLYREADAERLTASYAAVDVAAVMACRAAADASFFPPSRIGPRLPLVGVLSGGDPGRAARLARVLRWLGYRRFKVKVGRDADADARRLEAVRRAVGPGSWLAVDANAAWAWPEAVARMAAMRRWDVALVEEPLAAGEAASADFRRLETDAGVPVMADESLCTTGDAERLLARGGPSWWNLRLAKNGGFSGVYTLAEQARRHGGNVYGGILVGETSALALAASHAFFGAGARCGECGFPRLFLRGDPFRGAPGGFRGWYADPGVSGAAGVSLREHNLLKNATLVWKEERG